jgi:hypothetical protein
MTRGAPKRPFARLVLTTSARFLQHAVDQATALVPSAAMAARGVSSMSVPPNTAGVVHPLAAAADGATARSAAVTATAAGDTRRDVKVRMGPQRGAGDEGCTPGLPPSMTTTAPQPARRSACTRKPPTYHRDRALTLALAPGLGHGLALG